MVRRVSRRSMFQGLADVSLNLASGWIGIVLIAPGITGATGDNFLVFLTGNLFPAMITFGIGVYFLEKIKKYVK